MDLEFANQVKEVERMGDMDEDGKDILVSPLLHSISTVGPTAQNVATTQNIVPVVPQDIHVSPLTQP